jgi:hypothetical protein
MDDVQETLRGHKFIFLEFGLDKAGSSHFIITQSETIGPLTTSEVFRILENDKDFLIRVKWIAPSGQMPVLLPEWVDDFGFDAAPATDVPKGLLYDPEKPLSVASLNEGAGSFSKNRGILGKPEGFTLKRPKFPYFREVAALLGLGLLGGAIFYTGVRSMKPMQSSRNSGNTAHARLLNATPDSLKAYRQLLEAKILRDSSRYSQALLSLFKDRELFPPGQLPSFEFLAAQSLIHLDPKELDSQPEWKQLLRSLPAASRQTGLAVVAYELSRVKAARDDVLTSTRLKKASKSVVKATLEEVGIVLERLTRIVSSNNSENEVVHAVYLAKVLALSLVTISEHAVAAKQVPLVVESVKKVPSLYQHLKAVDKEIVEILRHHAAVKLGLDKRAEGAPSELDRLWSLHSESQYLCQLNDYGSASDAILFLLTEANRSRQKLPTLNGLFDGCFVGLRTYANVAVTSYTDENPLNLGFVQAHIPDRGILNEFRVRFPTMNQALLRAKGQNSAVGDWLLVLHFNGVLGSQFKLNHGFSATSRKCGKLSLESGVCLQALWYENQRHWKDLLPLLVEAQDYVRPAELSLLIQRFTLDAAKKIISGVSKSKSKELSELFAAVKNFGISDDPELQLVLDYARSLEDAS